MVKPFATEPTIEILADMSKDIIEGRQRMDQAFETEIKVKANVLQQVYDAMKDCLPHISSKLRFGTPYDSGFQLVKKPNGEELFLAEEGFFFVYDPGEGISSISVENIIRDRWNLREVVLAIAEEMKANLDGQMNKVQGVQRTTDKIAAVATLLGK